MSEQELAPGCNRCKAEEWIRDGRGLWAMRGCVALDRHGGPHQFSPWRYYVQPPTSEAERMRLAGIAWDEGVRFASECLRSQVFPKDAARRACLERVLSLADAKASA